VNIGPNIEIAWLVIEYRISPICLWAVFMPDKMGQIYLTGRNPNHRTGKMSEGIVKISLCAAFYPWALPGGPSPMAMSLESFLRRFLANQRVKALSEVAN